MFPNLWFQFLADMTRGVQQPPLDVCPGALLESVKGLLHLLASSRLHLVAQISHVQLLANYIQLFLYVRDVVEDHTQLCL